MSSPPARAGSVLRAGDERLARLAARGDERAFAELYARYHHQLYRYCRSILRADADAHDALQSTFERALRALRHDQRDAPLRPWLFRIAHNESISLLRRRSRLAAGVLEDAIELPGPSAAEQAEARADLAALVADLAELPERARSALLMRELNGLSHDEIATVLDTSVGAAKQAIFEARRALLELVEGRAMVCEDVQRTISDGDGRALRGRRVRAHLRDCVACAAFAAAIPARRAQLRALAPVLPPAASAAILARAVGGLSTHGAMRGLSGNGAGAAAGAASAGKTLSAAIVSKAVIGAAVVAVSAGGVAAVLNHRGHPVRHGTKTAAVVLRTGSRAPMRGPRQPVSVAASIAASARTARAAGNALNARVAGVSPARGVAASAAASRGVSQSGGRPVARHLPTPASGRGHLSVGAAHRSARGASHGRGRGRGRAVGRRGGSRAHPTGSAHHGPPPSSGMAPIQGALPSRGPSGRSNASRVK